MGSPLKERVKVGPFRFKFVEANLNPGSEDGFHFGLTQCHEATCYVHATQDSGMKRETYLHELLHAAFFVSGLSGRLMDDEEEKIIQNLSPLLIDILQSNPEFTNYITQVD